jgi:hypothetical protein
MAFAGRASRRTDFTKLQLTSIISIVYVKSRGWKPVSRQYWDTGSGIAVLFAKLARRF